MWGEAFEATWKLGIPVALLSWVMLHRLYFTGVITYDEDPDDLEKSINKAGRGGMVQSKWMQFGGGFYGAAALWTFFIMEMQQVLELLGDWTPVREALDDGLVAAIIALFVNQLMNFIDAIIWFMYWSGGGAHIWVWFVVAYVAYQLAAKTAQITSRLH